MAVLNYVLAWILILASLQLRLSVYTAIVRIEAGRLGLVSSRRRAGERTWASRMTVRGRM